MDFPGGRVPFTNTLQFIGGVFDSDHAKIPCYRTLDGSGQQIEDAMVPHDLQQQEATKLYQAMAKLQVMDTICYDAQRQVLCHCALNPALPAPHNHCCTASLLIAYLP